MANNDPITPKLLQYLPPIVLVVSFITGYTSLTERVNSLQTKQEQNDRVITPQEMKVRLESIQSDVAEIKHDVKELGKRK